ncbi:phytoene desaturase family protein [Chitinophaga arvensicola]|uniref:Phytoene desaturase n=1 Tax=Chitinophaga arvensicola TaxID=29529 RepID=A0A1I0R6L3_9BACT|nr:phytoene desaturase family protein [Chitinophaga arvensicola]SEW36270.1 phytoene desaturase [Chitinophaga arvensicola]
MLSKKVVVIGSGFAGLSASCVLAKAGFDVTVIEQHPTPGGRARQLKAAGFTFDMGPSWYWMPDVIERFFSLFDKTPADYYTLQRLSPSYSIYWPEGATDIPDDYHALCNLFEQLEPGSSKALNHYLLHAADKYAIGMQMAHKPGASVFEFADRTLLPAVLKMDLFSSMKKHVGKFFKHPQLRQLMEFPVLFLGEIAENIPAMYSFMNYADIKLGTWYPQGGMYSLVNAMHQLAIELGVTFHFNTRAEKIQVTGKNATHVHAGGQTFTADAIVGAADYHFIETSLLAPAYRSYSRKYWDSRRMAPSCLLYYIGLNKKLTSLQHHSLFFDVPFDKHARSLYQEPGWPEQPLFYVCCPSRTDNTVAPEGMENLFLLIPVATGLEGDDEQLRERYFQQIIARLEHHLGEPIADAVIYKKSYAGSDFIHDYNAFKGNAYGLANTLNQTAIMKPSMRSARVDNLYYAGQLTVPGPGVPPGIISGEIAANEIIKKFAR